MVEGRKINEHRNLNIAFLMGGSSITKKRGGGNGVIYKPLRAYLYLPRKRGEASDVLAVSRTAIRLKKAISSA
jgi:hypothetical protein